MFCRCFCSGAGNVHWSSKENCRYFPGKMKKFFSYFLISDNLLGLFFFLGEKDIKKNKKFFLLVAL